MTTRRMVITGGTGLLGKSLLELAPAGWEIVATYCATLPPEAWRSRFTPLDVRDEAAVARLFDAVRPHAVIHAASVGAVDEAERQPERVRAINVGGTQAVGRACERAGAAFLYISSNAVFDGTRPPYAEEAQVRAINRYGRIKIEAETWVRTRCRAPAAILRPILMYGWPLAGGRSNVVTRWIEQLERSQVVEVDPSLVSTPLYAPNAAEAVWACARLGRTGIYHLGGADRLSLLEFANAVARVFEAEASLVRPAGESFLRQFTPRPPDTSFVTAKMARELGVRPLGVREGLARMRRSRIRAEALCQAAR